MRTILKITFFVLLALGIAGECGAQDSYYNIDFARLEKVWLSTVPDRTLKDTGTYLAPFEFSGGSIGDPLTILRDDTIPFKPGSSLPAGSYVRDLYGTVWKVNIPISVAVTPPSTALKTSSGKAYYTYVSAGAPIQADVISEVYAINIQEVGVLPTNTPERNSQVFDSLLMSIPEGSSKSIYMPSGDYRFSKMIHIYRRPINLFGDNGSAFAKGTRLFFPANTDGIFIDRAGTSIQETIIEKIFLQSAGGDGSNGSGIRTNARVKLRDVTCKNFSRNGFDVWANLPEGGDASGSRIDGCHALENGLDGFFAGRVDANAILFINCDGRDNGRYNFNDDSMLGNNYISCMAHYGKQGDYYVRDKGNARSAFIACYAESGGKPSQFGPHSTIVGGFLASGYTQ